MNPSPSGQLPRWRIVLDGLASLSVIVVCSVVAWAVLFRGGLIEPRPSNVQAERPRPLSANTVNLPTAPVAFEGAATKGREDAQVVILTFTDFQCPYCETFVKSTLGQLEKAYVDTGKALMVVRHLPLESIHANAMNAAQAAECARRQGRFWEMHDLLFQHRNELDEKSIAGYAKTLALGPAFEPCMKGEALETVRADIKSAGELGIAGTPAFLIGTQEPGKRARIWARLSGAAPFERFRAEIERVISRLGNS